MSALFVWGCLPDGGGFFFSLSELPKSKKSVFLHHSLCFLQLWLNCVYNVLGYAVWVVCFSYYFLLKTTMGTNSNIYYAK